MADTKVQLAVKIKTALDNATGTGTANQDAADDIAQAIDDYISGRICTHSLIAPSGGGAVTGTITVNGG